MKITHRVLLAGYNYCGTTDYGFYFDPARYSGSVTLYYEQYFHSVSGAAAYFYLKDAADDSTIATVTTTETTATLVRSSSFTLSLATTLYTTSGGAATYDAGAWLIIVQDTGSSALTATCHEPVPVDQTYGSGTNTTGYTSNSLFWKYDSSKYDWTVTGECEIFYKVSSTKYGCTITVEEDDGTLTTWTTKVTVVNAGTATAWTRSTITFTPTDGRTYRIRCKSASTKGTIYWQCGVLRFKQTGTDLTKIVVSTYFTGGNQPYGSYDADGFTGVTVDARVKGYNSTSVTYTIQSNASGSWADISNATVTGSAWQESSTPATLPGSSCQIRPSSTSGILRAFVFYLTKSSSQIKTVQGLAKASVKTMNGLAIASVKTIQGLA